ncbi:hypothetical protein C8F01DRAFT_1228354 [Mycena amicta]|nr:hypothetical protein C8F01DRAFT_1228354 [Mycena amicta]
MHCYRSLLLFAILPQVTLSWAEGGLWAEGGFGDGDGRGGFGGFSFTRPFDVDTTTTSTTTKTTTVAPNTTPRPPPATTIETTSTALGTQQPDAPTSDSPKVTSSSVLHSISSKASSKPSKTAGLIVPASSTATPLAASSSSDSPNSQTSSISSKSSNHRVVIAIVVPLLIAALLIGVILAVLRRRRAAQNQKKWEGSHLPEMKDASRVSRISSMLPFGMRPGTREGVRSQSRNTLYSGGGNDWNRSDVHLRGGVSSPTARGFEQTTTHSDVSSLGDAESLGLGGVELSVAPDFSVSTPTPTPTSGRHFLDVPPTPMSASHSRSHFVPSNVSTALAEHDSLSRNSFTSDAYGGLEDIEMDLGYQAPHSMRHSSAMHSQISTVVADGDAYRSSLHIPSPSTYPIALRQGRPFSDMHSQISTVADDAASSLVATRAPSFQSDSGAPSRFSEEKPEAEGENENENENQSDIAAGRALFYSASPLPEQDERQLEPALAESHSRPGTLVRPLPVPSVPPMYTYEPPGSKSFL